MTYWPTRAEGIAKLRENLVHFCDAGLTALEWDLEQGVVVRAQWAGCPLSYAGGEAGSVRRDRIGKLRNEFTVLWDAYQISEEDVVAEVRAEMDRRAAEELAATAVEAEPELAGAF